MTMKLCLIPGDGIGREVVPVAADVLADTVSKKPYKPKVECETLLV